jgi:ribonucleotide monophosphatase NagD (HAD superfamily)
MPGLLMEKYQQLGGSVISFGKPKREYFDEAIYSSKLFPNISQNMSSILQQNAALSKPFRRKVIHIGDSLHHDIAGSVFVVMSS